LRPKICLFSIPRGNAQQTAQHAFGFDERKRLRNGVLHRRALVCCGAYEARRIYIATTVAQTRGSQDPKEGPAHIGPPQRAVEKAEMRQEVYVVVIDLAVYQP
jgi:hypothetical protein